LARNPPGAGLRPSSRAALQPLKNYYERKKSRGTGKAIALARKFLGIIYRTLQNKWLFEYFPTLYWRRKPRHET
jgi:hypothetical protein